MTNQEALNYIIKTRHKDIRENAQIKSKYWRRVDKIERSLKELEEYKVAFNKALDYIVAADQRFEEADSFHQAKTKKEWRNKIFGEIAIDYLINKKGENNEQ